MLARYVDDLVELVRLRYPEWAGFDHPPFVADEIEYKQATIERAAEELSAGEVKHLLAGWEYDELIRRLERTSRHNNLLWTRAPRTGDLSILYAPNLDKALFCHQIGQLLHGEGPAPGRLHNFARFVSEQRLPLKWTFPTYFLFILHPETEMFVKPRTVDWFLKFMGHPAGLPNTPAGPAYTVVREQVAALQQALAAYGPQDMVDMQSFIWVAYRESTQRTGRLDTRGQVELDIPPTMLEPTLYEVPAYGLALRETAGEEETIDNTTATEPTRYEENEPYTLAECAADTGIAEEQLAEWVQAIERKGQAVFYGPPGTGKTFLARKLAQHLSAGSDGFWELVQFHPAYSYEEFVQGIRPVSRPDGQVGYELVPGRFLRFCEQAAGRSGRCVLVIDEINRANLPAVLGELMYLLEYRQETVSLAGGGRFHIPANVRVLGTMNTADRSIALVDHALRRRFAFIQLQPDFDILRHYHQREETGYAVEPLIRVLHDLNNQINDPHYEVGVSFFLRPSLTTDLPGIWQTEIEPYLEEYFFNQPEQVATFRWENVRKRL